MEDSQRVRNALSRWFRILRNPRSGGGVILRGTVFGTLIGAPFSVLASAGTSVGLTVADVRSNNTLTDFARTFEAASGGGLIVTLLLLILFISVGILISVCLYRREQVYHLMAPTRHTGNLLVDNQASDENRVGSSFDDHVSSPVDYDLSNSGSGDPGNPGSDSGDPGSAFNPKASESHEVSSIAHSTDESVHRHRQDEDASRSHPLEQTAVGVPRPNSDNRGSNLDGDGVDPRKLTFPIPSYSGLGEHEANKEEERCPASLSHGCDVSELSSESSIAIPMVLDQRSVACNV